MNTDEIPGSLAERWKDMLDFAAELAEVSAVLFIRTGNENLRILVSSNTEKSLINQEVMQRNWDEEIVKLGMTDCLEIPIHSADGTFLGKLCVGSGRGNTVPEVYANLLCSFRDIIEDDLKGTDAGKKTLGSVHIRSRTAELERQLQFFKRIADHTYDWEVFRNENGQIVYINQAFERITGFKTDDILNGKITEKDVVHPDDFFYVSESILRSVQKLQTVDDLQFRVLRKDGRIRYVNLCASPVFENEIFIGTRTSVRDITEQHSFLELQAVKEELEFHRVQLEKKNQELEKREKYFRTLIENAPDGVVLVGPDGKMKYASPAARRMFGFVEEKGILPDPAENTHPDDLARVLSELQKVIENENYSPKVEYRFLTADQGFRWIESTFTNQYQNEDIKALIINFRIIDDKKKVELSLHRSEEFLKESERIANMASWEYDILQDRLYWSDNCHLFYGYRLGEIDPSYELFKSHVHPDDLHIVSEKFESIFSDGKPYTGEMRILLQSGVQKWVQNNVEAVWENGRIVKLKGIQLDISERKEAIEKLRMSEERYLQFITQAFEAISRTEFDRPVDISLPAEQQIDLIYENAYLAECNQAMADMYNTTVEKFIGTRLINAHGGKDNTTNRDAFRRFIQSGYRSTNDETEELT
ncbi:MAG TPA: PAS domain-containing protein, partial [Leptospiraceae bacterium]|nr:PAS domain-containing protein [Leptospiraceae bacterium]